MLEVRPVWFTLSLESPKGTKVEKGLKEVMRKAASMQLGTSKPKSKSEIRRLKYMEDVRRKKKEGLNR